VVRADYASLCGVVVAVRADPPPLGGIVVGVSANPPSLGWVGVTGSADAAARITCNDRLLRLTYRSCEPRISGHVYDELSDL